MRLKKSLLFISLLSALVSCGGSGGGGNAISGSYSLQGQVQKGPLIFGSRIWVSELDSNLNPNGKTYLAQTKDDLGNFVVSSTVGSNLVELLGMGYYMDELTGSLSTSPITLSAIADLGIDRTPTINILTTLQAPRVKNLILQGKNYSEALNQSQAEVLSVFGIDSAKIDSLQSLYAMSINGTTDQDSALLAASTVLSKMSSIAAATNSSSQAAEMSYYLSRIASEIADTGTLTSQSIISAKTTASLQIDLSAVRSNIETYYSNRGISMTAPKFEEWIDKDGSGALPRRLTALRGITFTSVTDAEHSQVVTSNTVSVTGLSSGNTVSVSIDPNGSIIKNNSLISGRFTTAVNGDSLAIRLTSGRFGVTNSSTISVGSTQSNWSVTTRTPTIFYAIDSNNSSGASASTGMYYAHPFIPSTSNTLKYLAIGSSGSGLESISVHANDSTGGSDKPVFPALSTSNTFGNYFDVALNDTNGQSHSPLSRSSAYFGSSGVALTNGTKYWIVMKYPTSGSNDSNTFSNSATDYGRRLVSPNGTNWSDWQGQVSGTYATNALPIYLAN